MHVIKHLASIFLLTIPAYASAQVSLLGLLNGDQRQDSNRVAKTDIGSSAKVGVLESALRPSLSILRQQYRLELNGNYYGKNGNAFYGETYSLGIKVSGGMLFLDDVVEPWKNDADYKRANADGKYKTEYFWTYQRKLTDSTYKAVDLELGSDFTKPQNAGKSLWKHQDKDGDLGLDIDQTAGLKSGNMVWAYASTNVRDSAMTVSLAQSAITVNARRDTTVALSPDNSDRVLGGLFVVPKYGVGGRVQFLLAGVAVRADGSKWTLQLLAQGGSAPAESADNATPRPSADSSAPTPSGKKDKKSKRDRRGKKAKK